ncbi:FIG00759408: hypothetical protein [hydrothermal vent metagenome]|uniref:Transposase IS200-like domain-containing protein n=1 Tax=hydrothermal vent metagenome TaxID=652676 RepID=A0A3B0YQ25_9ZZZZ
MTFFNYLGVRSIIWTLICYIWPMARPLRIEYPGALYYVTSRGDRQAAIYADDEDRQSFLSVLQKVVARYNWVCHAYCQMTDHYHLLIETPDGNLSRGMRHLNGVFTQLSNRRHQRRGALFQGRYKAILLDADAYLLELSRYIVLNPVRTGAVNGPADWCWSSFLAMSGMQPVPAFLTPDRVLSLFAGNPQAALKKYQAFVAQGLDAKSPWAGLRKQIYLGDEAFVKHVQTMLGDMPGDVNVAKMQKQRQVKTLDRYEREALSRNAAIVSAYDSGGYSYQDIAAYYELHFTSIARIVRKARNEV